ncbi:MAG: cation:proton antiporter [Ignavibacteria bacterium]|nr:cation:proton antiporter [Ignavibacteria bacterium]
MLILQDIIIILFSSIVIIFIFSKLKVPPVVGFLLTGIVIGPYSAGIIKNSHEIEILAEIGVVLMLFIIGIEFSIKKLIRIKKLIFIAGGGQVLITIILVCVISVLIGFDYGSAVFFGFLISLSSTAIVLKLLQDKRQIDSPQGKIELGILLFQDLCVVPMIILVPVLAASSGDTMEKIFLRIIISFLLIILIFFTARKLMPILLNLIVSTRLKEIFIISSLFLCLGMAFLTNKLGLSFALGAFIAGVIISESRYSHQIIADVMPFKEGFNGLFFISIGMLLNLNYLTENFFSVAALSSGIFLTKGAIIFILTLLLRYPIRIAVIAAFSLAQIGEFSFVIAKLGLGYSLISEDLFQLFLSASIITMIFTPFAFIFSPQAARKLEEGRLFSPLKKLERKSVSHKTDSGKAESETVLKNHTIIVGYGLNGRNLARILKKRKVPYVIIELNPENVIEAEKNSEYVVYGDATKSVILQEAGIKKAKVVTYAISDPFVIDHAVATARILNPDVYIIARTKYVSEIDKLYELGADTVFAEEYETSIEIIARVLSLYGISKEMIQREIAELHKQRYEKFRDKEGRFDITERIHQVIHEEVDVESFTVSHNCSCEEKTIAELDIRAKTGATIISVIRGRESFPNPSSDFKIRQGDIVLMLGTRGQIEKAIEILR